MNSMYKKFEVIKLKETSKSGLYDFVNCFDQRGNYFNNLPLLFITITMHIIK